PAPEAEREERVERALLEQRVPAGQQEAVEVRVLGRALADLPLVDAEADGPHRPRAPQPVERRVRAVERLPVTGGLSRRTVSEGVDVVDEGEIAPLEPEPSQARLDRPERAVSAVVEDGTPGRQLDVRPGSGLARGARLEEPTDLGRKDER